AGVDAAVDPVELVDQEVGVAQAQVLDELLLVACLDALDLEHPEGEHRRQELITRVAPELWELAFIGAGQQPEPDPLAGVGQRGLEAVPGEQCSSALL